MISLITKWLFIAVLVSSCGSIKDKIFKKKKKVISNRPSVNYGPSKNSTSTFEDYTSQVALNGVRGSHFYIVDFDNDGDDDLVLLPEFYSTPSFYSFNSKDKKFHPLSIFPFEKGIKGSFLVFNDFDKDGILDLIVASANQSRLVESPIRIFKGFIKKGLPFYQEIQSAYLNSLKTPVSTISVLDYNYDGYLDLFIGNWFAKNSGKYSPKEDILLRGKGFEFKKSTDFLDRNPGPTMSSSICDLDQNGRVDLITTSSSGRKNKTWLQRYDKKLGKFVFKDYSEQMGTSEDSLGKKLLNRGGNTFFSSCEDYNNDEIMDLIVGEVFHSYSDESLDRSAVLTGSKKGFPPQFIRSNYYEEDLNKSWSEADKRAVWFDYDNDSLVDIIVDNTGFPPETRLVLFKQYKDHSYENISKSLGVDIVNPSGSAVFDYNDDGALDFITGQVSIRESRIQKRLYFFKNKKNINRKVKFYLRAKKSNLQGIGAFVKVYLSNGKKLNKFFRLSEGSYPSQNADGIHFGLEKEYVKKVNVIWPYKKNGKSLKRTYSLPIEDKKREYNIYTLCENGKVKKGRVQRCL